MPEPWILTSDWFDRLEVSEKERRHYRHLSSIERQKIETDRLLAESYEREHLLKEGKTKGGLLTRVAEDIDRTWLRPGKGRAVDFKHTLKVLETYATYRAWAGQYQESTPVLDVVVPYIISKIFYGLRYVHCGPGFIRLKLVLNRPYVGTLGKVLWDEASFSMTEVCVTGLESGTVISRAFDRNPFSYLDTKLATRNWTFALNRDTGQFGATSSLGFVDLFKKSWRAWLGMEDGRPCTFLRSGKLGHQTVQSSA
ncbi:MAG: hypothetical protein NUV54_02410, partial [Candidatus Taylorbacteria bacterium]|nr:hypothetical protein [Candidatus Taylorbacteria bacterium]